MSLRGDGTIKMVGSTWIVFLDNAHLVLRGPTLEGNDNFQGLYGLVYLNDYRSTFVMQDGGIINNNAVSGGPGAIYSHGTFVMNGGIISNNTSNSQYGTIYMDNSIFTMHGGKIIDNHGIGVGGKLFKNDDDNHDGDSGEISRNISSSQYRNVKRSTSHESFDYIDKDIGPQQEISDDNRVVSPWNEPR